MWCKILLKFRRYQIQHHVHFLFCYKQMFITMLIHLYTSQITTYVNIHILNHPSPLHWALRQSNIHMESDWQSPFSGYLPQCQLLQTNAPNATSPLLSQNLQISALRQEPFWVAWKTYTKLSAFFKYVNKFGSPANPITSSKFVEEYVTNNKPNQVF